MNCKFSFYTELNKNTVFLRTPLVAASIYSIFLLKLCTHFLLNIVYKGCSGFSLDLKLLIKMWECRNQSFLIFENNSRSKQNKKDLKHLFADIGNWETCVKFQQKIFSSMATRTHQSFQFLRQNNCVWPMCLTISWGWHLKG